MISKVDRGYAMLYRFLREKRLLDSYLGNISKRPYNIKEALRHSVGVYIIDHAWKTYNTEFFEDLFNWAPSSFYWDRSIEGEDFWRSYYNEWKRYYDREKVKYML